MPTRGNSNRVCVIGTGAAGGVVIWELARRGIEVVALEAGKRYSPDSNYFSHCPDYETRGINTFSPPSPKMERYTVESGNFIVGRVRAVGGGTVAYGMVSPRFLPSDFQVKTLDGVADDWPFTYQELAPYYRKVEYLLGVSGRRDNSLWPDVPYPNPPHPFHCATKTIIKGAAKLGIKVHHCPVANLSRPYAGRPSCNYCGCCAFGCKRRAKSSMDVTLIPQAEKTGRVKIHTNCMVRKITLDTKGLVNGVIYFDRKGIEKRLTVGAVVLCCNGIETPRLLLNSANSQFPEGLANKSGLVGKYLMEHPSISCQAYFEQRLNAYKAIDTGIITDFSQTAPENDFVRGYKITNYFDEGPLELALMTGGYLWGLEHKEFMQRYFGHRTQLVADAEQLPYQFNRVTIDPNVKDYWGIPVPKIHFKLAKNEERMLSTMKTKIRQIMEAAEGQEIEEQGYIAGVSNHYLGTCRMGKDPEKSVVDGLGRCHHITNLFVADGSTFVTGSSMNPTLTIQAAALRMAEDLS